MRTSKDVGKQAHDTHTEPCNCGEAVFRRLPTVVCETLTCSCIKDYRDNREWLCLLGIKQGGSYCTLCGKPERFSIHKHFFTCEGCNKFYTYDFRTFPKLPNNEWITWPPPNLLCKDCDVPSPTRRRGIVFD